MGIIDQLPNEYRDLMRPIVRVAFVPKTEPGDPRGPMSKIGGTPWLSSNESWPRCGDCDQQMPLLLQLDLARLPAGAPGGGSGLAQLFYCFECDDFCPFSNSQVERLLDPSTDGEDATPRVSLDDAVIAPKRIVGWDHSEDLPETSELSDCLGGLEVDGELCDAILANERPLFGDKLGGWPHWIQDIEYPSCPDCKAPMQLLYQIDSEDLIEHKWGDSGCAHLTQCGVHRHRLAFTWACC